MAALIAGVIVAVLNWLHFSSLLPEGEREGFMHHHEFILGLAILLTLVCIAEFLQLRRACSEFTRLQGLSPEPARKCSDRSSPPPLEPAVLTIRAISGSGETHPGEFCRRPETTELGATHCGLIAAAELERVLDVIAFTESQFEKEWWEREVSKDGEGSPSVTETFLQMARESERVMTRASSSVTRAVLNEIPQLRQCYQGMQELVRRFQETVIGALLDGRANHNRRQETAVKALSDLAREAKGVREAIIAWRTRALDSVSFRRRSLSSDVPDRLDPDPVFGLVR
jgi:hypothetical protein